MYFKLGFRSIDFLINGEEIVVEYQPKKGMKGQIRLPLELSLNKLTFMCVGLYNGEGYHANTSSDEHGRITFSNTMLDYHKLVLKWFEQLKQPKEKFGLRFGFPRGLLPKEKSVNQKWSSELGISRVWKKYIINGKKIVGTICYNNSFFREVLNKIRDRVRAIATSNSLYTSWYLTGVYAGEGSIWLGKRGITPIVRISYNPKTEKDLKNKYIKCLRLLEIRNYSIDDKYGFITICGILNTWRLMDSGIFDLRNKENINRKLLEANYCYLLSSTLRKFLFKDLKISEIRRLLNVSQSTIYDWKGGKYSMTKKYFYKICKLKNINPLKFVNQVEQVVIANQKITNPPLKFVKFTLSDFK